MKFIRFVKQTILHIQQIQTEVKQEPRKLNEREKVKKAPRIEGINLQTTSIANALMLDC